MSAKIAASRREAVRREQALAAERARRRRILLVGLAVLALVLGVVVGTTLLKRDKEAPVAVTEAGLPSHANAERSGIVMNPGKRQGKPLVAIYSDYQCGHCKQFEAKYGPILDELAAKGEVVLESRTMTFMERQAKNSSSTRPAIAAACADRVGKYSAFHEAVFAHRPEQLAVGQESFSDELLRAQIPEQVGITGQQLTDFQACYDSRSTEGFVKQVDDLAFKAKIPGTPAMTVNGKLVDFEKVDLGDSAESVMKVITDHA